MPGVQEVALTLFRLRPGITVEQYRAFSLDTVRAGMLRMPAVEGFLDLEVVGSLTGTDGWEVVELILITSRAAFIHDNDTIGSALATSWEEWVADYRVVFLRDLDVSGTGQPRLSVTG